MIPSAMRCRGRTRSVLVAQDCHSKKVCRLLEMSLPSMALFIANWLLVLLGCLQVVLADLP